jgi:quinol-cytochrome oxidoreductase complex cytochrome b subunit
MSEPTPSEPQGKKSGGWIDWLERRINLSEIFSYITSFGAVLTPIDSSRPIRDVVKEVGTQPVSVYAHWPRVLGLIAVILFVLQAITGILLAFYYQATPEAAFESTRIIVRDLPFGWLIHQIHSWGAYLLVAVLLVRLLRLFWDGLYRSPRELMWWCALGLVSISYTADFTGRLLPWDNDSYWSVVRGLEVITALPGFAPVFNFIIGGSHVVGDVLTRFYVLHVLILPLVFVVFLYLTFATLRRVGMSPAPGSVAMGSTSFRNHLYTTLILTVLAFGVLVSLAVLVPFPFLSEADPYTTPVGMVPPWYLLAPFAVLELAPIPAWLSGLLLIAVSLFVILFPLWLKGEATAAGLKRARLIGSAVVLIWIVLIAVGAFMERA